MTSYRNILEFFFQIHDPTTLNRQGNDRGLSYRSGIYYVDEEQKRVAEDTIADVDASGLWDGKVVTEVQPVGEFWEAEPDHQDYLEKHRAATPATSSVPAGCFRSAKRLTTYSQRPGPRRNRLHCRCHCAGPVRNLRDRVVQRRGHRTYFRVTARSSQSPSQHQDRRFMPDLSSFPITQRWPASHPDRLQLYAAPTPNGVKVSIMLEETGRRTSPT